MPDTITEADRALAKETAEQFDLIRDSMEALDDAKADVLRARFRWGRRVQAARERAEYGDGVVEEIAKQIDRSASFVRNHSNWAAEIENAFSVSDPVEGFRAYCQEEDRNLSWREALRWMRERKTDEDEEEAPPTHDIDQKKRNVERRLGQLEEEANELAELYLDHYGELPDGDREEVEGVITAAQQTLQDREEAPAEAERGDPHTMESDAYRSWVAKKGCVSCGVIDDTVTGHHLERKGTAAKEDDTLCVGLCVECHTALHGMDEERFWEEYAGHGEGVNPWRWAAKYQAEILARLDQIADILEIT